MGTPSQKSSWFIGNSIVKNHFRTLGFREHGLWAFYSLWVWMYSFKMPSPPWSCLFFPLLSQSLPLPQVLRQPVLHGPRYPIGCCRAAGRNQTKFFFSLANRNQGQSMIAYTLNRMHGLFFRLYRFSLNEVEAVFLFLFVSFFFL